jgi:hypothetical protein
MPQIATLKEVPMYVPEIWNGPIRIDMAYGPYDVFGLAKFMSENHNLGLEIRVRCILKTTNTWST